MRSKGFTLIELLAVIVILAVIALIATPIILGIINDTKKQAFEVEAKNIEDAAKYYLTKGLKIEEVPKYDEYYIPVSDLTNYLNNVKDEMLEENVIVKKTDNSINYYYTGRDKNQYLNNQTLKFAVESDTTHILTNKKVNGIPVNKVIGTKAEKTTMKNWVWYGVRPVLVLKSNIKVTDGDGTPNSPYVLDI